MIVEEHFMRFEPGAEARRNALILSGLLVLQKNGLSVDPDRGSIGGIVWERRCIGPIMGQPVEAMQRESLDQCLFDPLAGIARLGIKLPAIAQHMAELMPELIGEIAPVS